MPLSTTPTPFTDEDADKLRAECEQHLADLARKLGDPGTAADDADVRRTNREYGKQLSVIGRAAADTVADGGAAFQGLPCTAQSIRAKDTRVRLLHTIKETAEQFAELVTRLYQAARVDLAGDVRLVVQTADATEAHPVTTPAVRETVGRAARPLRTLIEGRKADAIAAVAATRAKNASTETSLAAKDEENTALRDDNSRLTVENRYLAGETLRPADVIATPAPATAPARAVRRGPQRRNPR